MTFFTDLNLEPSILDALKKLGFDQPKPIQKEAIPLIQEGKDLVALAETGSGKTAACAIPLCNRVDVDKPAIQGLIIVPTRELGLQYATETQKIGKRRGVKSFALLGGEDAGMQQSKLNHGVQILIATPGRLIDFIYSRQVDLSEVDTLVLDEADEMLSMGFVEDLDFIRDCLVHTHQTLLFSATMSKSIRSLAERFLSNPVEIKLNREKLSPDQIQHFFVACQPGKKLRRLVDLYKELEPAYSIIFCQSRHSCEGLVKDTKNQIRGVDYLHGGLSQDVRRIITRKFRTKKTRHLIATDVASRGLDFSGISHVFHYELPHDPEVFVHRSGRTGRNDASGVVVTLVTPRDRRMLDRICKMMGKEAQWIGEPLQKEGKKSTKGKRPQRKTARKGDAEARN